MTITKADWDAALDACTSEFHPDLVRPRARAVRWLPLAAALLIGLAAGMLLRPSPEPSLLAARHELHASGARGGGEVARIDAASPQLLVLHVSERCDGLELIGENTRWSVAATPADDGTLHLQLPARFLEPGRYRIDTYANGELLERFPFVVAAQPLPR